MLDRRTRVLLGKSLVIVIGPLLLAASLLVIGTAGETISTAETMWSYLAFMAAFAAIAGGAFLWIRNR